MARCTEWGFKPEDIIVLTDNNRGFSPTKATILWAMNWLVKDAKAGDSLFFFCERTSYIPDWSAYIFQTLVMVRRSAILTAMRPTDGMKVGGGDRKKCLSLTVRRSHCSA